MKKWWVGGGGGLAWYGEVGGGLGIRGEIMMVRGGGLVWEISDADAEMLWNLVRRSEELKTFQVQEKPMSNGLRTREI